ncbi:MAG TPA: polyphosphate kinase 2 [Spongiibacteraceae bacterium]|nr:polyphosphate kinase 2 [Spongiibacteraceae bacterium]
MTHKAYEATLRELQIELVKAQRHLIESGMKVLVIFEGRDAAGKDGTIKRIVEHLSPRETRVVAMPKPSDRDRASWYFQRYVPQLPAEQELVVFNRSWYNRAGVERVMGFCSTEEYEAFMNSVIPFEQMLVNSGIKLIKYYLDIDKDEQRKRLQERRDNPLKQWKISPIDEAAQKCWKKYSAARDAMFTRSHNLVTPWYIVRADDKNIARLNVIKHLLTTLATPATDPKLTQPDNSVVFTYDPTCFEQGLIAR